MCRIKRGLLSMDSKRLDYIDYAKGLGIILVVAGHLIGEAEMGEYESFSVKTE